MSLVVKVAASFICLLAFLSGTDLRAQPVNNYSKEKLIKFAEKNRAEQIVYISLYLCPDWYEMLQGGPIKKIDTVHRLVAKKVDGNEPIFNPTGELEGWSISSLDLTTLRKVVAKEQWGAREHKNGIFTCDFITAYGSPEKEIYHLDLKFTGEVLDCYRLRGTGILGSTDWVKNKLGAER